MAQNLLAGFVQGMAQGKSGERDRQLIEDFKKTQKKLLDAQVDATVTQQQAREKFASLFEPGNQPEPGMEGPPQQVQPGKSFIELLSDPEGQLAGLQAGIITPKDIGLERERQMLGNLNLDTTGGLGFTPESVRLFQATRDPKVLEAIKPVQKVVQGEDGPRIKSLNPLTGQEIADLGPAKEEKLPVGDVGKIQSIDFAAQQLNDAIELIAPGGVLDKKMVFALTSPIKVGTAREIDALIGDAIATKVLIQSGVTAREDEIERTKRNFVPSALDLTKPGLAERKLQRLRDFMEGAIDLTVLPPSLKKRIEGKKNKPSLNLGKKVKPEDIQNLSDEELQAIIDGE